MDEMKTPAKPAVKSRVHVFSRRARAGVGADEAA
jgi:hypothetical protein